MGGFREVGTVDPVDKDDFVGVHLIQEIFLYIPVFQVMVLFWEKAEIHLLQPVQGGVFPGLQLPVRESFSLEIFKGLRADLMNRVVHINLVFKCHE